MQFYQGDDFEWLEAAPDDASEVVVWLRTRVAGSGHQLEGVDTESGWKFTLPASVTAGMVAGTWSLQVNAIVDDKAKIIRQGQITVLRGLAFTGSAPAFDDRSQAARDLESVGEAIRLLASIDGPQEYTISGGGSMRRVTRADLSDLIRWRDQLKAEVAAEERAARGKSRRILARFVP
jgi:hypothetical protein